MSQFPIITIDGPSASGKTTISKLLAERLDWHWASTGIIYRLIGFLSLKEDLSIDDTQAHVKLINGPLWNIKLSKKGAQALYKDTDVTPKLFNERVGAQASKLSQVPEIRKCLLQSQRDLAVYGPLIAEGRDCGTVVFPTAGLKVYITASEELRAQRRASEYNQSVAQSLAEQKDRDKRDSERKVAPLKAAEDAVTIDTTNSSLDEVVENLFQLAQKSFNL